MSIHKMSIIIPGGSLVTITKEKTDEERSATGICRVETREAPKHRIG